MKAVYKFFMWYYNMLGITSLSARKDVAKISKIMIWVNSVSLPLLYGLNFFLISISEETEKAEEKVERSKFMESGSKFLLFVVNTFGIQYMIVMIFLIYSCIWNQKEILGLIQSCMRVFQEFKLSTKTAAFMSLEKQCFLNFFAATFISFVLKTVLIWTLLSRPQRHWFSFFVFAWYENTSLFFMVFVSFFLFYFLFLLKHLNLKIESLSKLKTRKVWIYDALTLKFISIDRLVTKFNSALGVQLSIVVVLAISVTTTRVKLLFR